MQRYIFRSVLICLDLLGPLVSRLLHRNLQVTPHGVSSRIYSDLCYKYSERLVRGTSGDYSSVIYIHMYAYHIHIYI